MAEGDEGLTGGRFSARTGEYLKLSTPLTHSELGAAFGLAGLNPGAFRASLADTAAVLLGAGMRRLNEKLRTYVTEEGRVDGDDGKSDGRGRHGKQREAWLSDFN